MAKLLPQDTFALQNNFFVVKDGALGGDVSSWANCFVRELDQSLLHPARIGSGTNSTLAESYRGDSIAWLTSKFEQDDPSNRLYSALKEWRSGIIQCLGLQCTRSSVQLAKYEGTGARYVRHSDVEVSSNHHSNDGENVLNPSERRIYTVVYYLNPMWTAENGGSLRVFYGSNEHIDVEPIADRMIIFPSHLEHEVLPSHGRSRWAITLWIYGPSEHVNHCDRTSRSIQTRIISDALINGRIFVSIACYRDREVFNTISNLFARADDVSRISVGVCWQGDNFPSQEMIRTISNQELLKQVRWCMLPTEAASGPLHARNIILDKLYGGERFLLQIDAHTRFAEKWDTRLLSDLRLCKSPKPILTAYPAGYRLGESTTVGGINPQINLPSPILCADRFDEKGILRIVGRQTSVLANDPEPSLFWAAGFSFSEARAFFESDRPDIPYLFFGEETLMAYYFYRHGWELFTPSKSNVVFHLWNSRSANPETALIISGENRIRANREYSRLIDEYRESGKFAEYERFVGVDFKAKSISEKAKLGGRTSWAEFKIGAALPTKAVGLIEQYLH